MYLIFILLKNINWFGFFGSLRDVVLVGVHVVVVVLHFLWFFGGLFFYILFFFIYKKTLTYKQSIYV